MVDNLLTLGYENLTVLDISAAAITRAKNRLGENAQKIKWIVSDIVDFQPTKKYALWHDRAAFHFLTQDKEIQNYTQLLNNYIVKNGFVIIGAFSDNGHKKCSGLEIKQYSEQSLTNLLSSTFEKKIKDNFFRYVCLR